MLTEAIINLIVLILAMIGIGWFIVHVRPKANPYAKKCANCFWLYYLSRNEVACTDYDPLVRHISKSIINKFYCAHHWFQKEDLNKSIGKGGKGGIEG